MAENGALSVQAQKAQGAHVATKCKATTATGAPCRAWAGPSGYCFQHDPDRATERARARARGGHASARLRCLPAANVKGVADLLPVLSRVLDDVLQNEASPTKRARCVVAVARAYYELSIGTEFERRLEVLENAQVNRVREAA